MFDLSHLGKTTHRIDIISTYSGSDNPANVTVVKKGDRQYERFFYIADGTAAFELSDKTVVKAPKGTIIYLPFDAPYRCTWNVNDGCEYMCLNFVIYGKNNDIINFNDKICVVLYDERMKYLNLFQNINKEWISSVNSNLTTIMKFYKILCEIKNDLDFSENKSTHNIQRVISYINENYTENTPVDELAKMAGMGTTAFRKEFKSAAGNSAVKYRNGLRLRKAKEMLETTEYNICEISEVLGFSDIYYFSKLFKQHYSYPPSSYKKRSR